jgi:hypothetical protein
MHRTLTSAVSKRGGEDPKFAVSGEARRHAMFPLDPIGGDRPDTRRQPRRDDTPPNDGNDGNKALWILGIMAGALGIFAVVSAI